MGRAIFNMNVEAWIKGIVVEDCASIEEAKEELLSMSLAEILLYADGYVKDAEYTEITCDEMTVDVRVSNIKYDIKPEDDVDESELETEWDLCDIDITNRSKDELDEVIADALSDETGYMIKSFTYEIYGQD